MKKHIRVWKLLGGNTLISLNDWQEILKVQITNTKQGIKTSQRKLPKPDDEDCYPPLLNLFSKWSKLNSIFDPSSTLVLNFNHGFSPEQICDFKNKGLLMFSAGYGDFDNGELYGYSTDCVIQISIPNETTEIIFSANIFVSPDLSSLVHHAITVRNKSKAADVMYAVNFEEYNFKNNTRTYNDLMKYVKALEEWCLELSNYLSDSGYPSITNYYEAVLDLPMWVNRGDEK